MENRSRIKELQDDFMALKRFVAFMWKCRVTYIIYMAIAGVLAIIIAYSIPKTYTTTVMLAPETSNDISGGLSGLANLAGLNMGNMGEDAYTVDLYPTIISSRDFLLDIYDMRVVSVAENIDTTYNVYLSDFQKSAWWSYPGIWLGELLSSDKEEEEPEEIQSSFSRRLTKEEYTACNTIKGKIRCLVNAVSGIITITVNDQNPEISAMVADSVVVRLNQFIMDYRTRKARADYEYISTICDSAKNVYFDVQKRYADYVATHTNIYSPVNKAHMEFLSNEVSLAYSAYSQVSSQKQMAQAKIMESIPVYTFIESAYVPMIPSSPRKMIILLFFLFVGFLAATIKISVEKINSKK